MLQKRLISLVIISVLLLGLTGCFKKGGGGSATDLVMYGLDDSDVIEPIITQYREKHSNVRIRYKKFNNPADFENLMVNEIAEGEGPDIFYVHNTWLPRHLKKIVPLQSESLTPEKFSEVFVKVAADDFVQPEPASGVKKIYALPLYVDTLALYYNKRDFEQKLPERGKPAANWEAFKDEADRFRAQDDSGTLSRGAIAMGRADNMRLAVDVLYHLFLQSGVEMYTDDFKQVKFNGAAGQEVFEYFIGFALPQNKEFSWGLDLAPANSPSGGEVEAFLSGKVSAVLAYSDLYPRLDTELKNVKSRTGFVISKNDIGVMASPQFADKEADYKVLANYSGLAVSRNSKNQTAAWDFVQFAASKENARAYHSKTKRPAARRDLIEEQKKESVTDVFVSQLGYATSYRIFSDQRFAQYLGEAINAAASGQTPRQALASAQEKINDLLKLEAPEGLYPKPKKK